MHPSLESQEHLARWVEAEKRSARTSAPNMKKSYIEIAAQYRRLAQEAAAR
jgi:hypothetical protein